MNARDLWAQWRHRRAEQRRWADAPDFAAARELNAQWCEGRMTYSAAGHPRYHDPDPVQDELARINRSGLMTTEFDTGSDARGPWPQQRAYVSGFCTPETEEQLRHLIAGTRLQMRSHVDEARWRETYDGAASFRYREGDDFREGPAWLGARPRSGSAAAQLDRVSNRVFDEVDNLPYVTVWDPQWRPSDLLWRRLSCDWEHPPRLSDDDRAPADAVPSDAEVDRLNAEMEAAFRERDRLSELGDDAGADVADRLADYLLTLYNAACQAQYAEMDRRRDFNVARYSRDENVKRGDLANALKGDDWLEDHGMPADERATCHQCQSWADHSHGQTNEQTASGGNQCGCGVEHGWHVQYRDDEDDEDGEACGICGHAETAHPATWWAPGGVDPDDGHHYCPSSRRCPTCQITITPPGLVVDLPSVPSYSRDGEPQ